MDCATCPHHEATLLKVSENTKDINHLETCNAQLKLDIQEVKTNQALLSQKIDNLRWPVWIIFTGVLAQIGHWIFQIPELGG